VCCSILQSVAVCCSHTPCAQGSTEKCAALCVAVCSGVLWCAVVCCTHTKHVLKAAVNSHFLSALQRVAVCCSVSQCATVCCSPEACLRIATFVVAVLGGCCGLVWKGAVFCYGAVKINRLFKIIGLFCKRAL